MSAGCSCPRTGRTRPPPRPRRAAAWPPGRSHSPAAGRGARAGGARSAITDPAAHASQPMRPSSRPAHEVRAPGDHLAEVREIETERDRAQAGGQQRPGPLAAAAHQDEPGARAPDREVDQVRHERGGLARPGSPRPRRRGRARRCPGSRPGRSGRPRARRPGSRRPGPSGRRRGVSPGRRPAAPARGGVTGTIVPGASIEMNRAHAPDQPSGVSGHHSIGCDCVAPARPRYRRSASPGRSRSPLPGRRC